MTNDSRSRESDESRETDADSSADEDRRRARWRLSRRGLMRTAGTSGLIAGLGGLGLAQAQQPTEIRLGGEVDGWTVLEDADTDVVGDGPNPTLTLQAGREYEVYWENLDGLPHNFAVLDAEGESLVRSEIISEQDASQTVSFTAEEAMAEYYCEVHPNTMRGDVQVEAGTGTPGTAETEPGTETEEATDAQPRAGFFEEGARVGVETVAEGMTAPTDFADPDDGSGRHFVTDQTGEVWVVTEDGRQSEPFMDVSDRMVELGEFFGDYADAQQDYDERGLLGIAFHPEFADNSRFYLHYSAPPDGVDRDLPGDNWDHWEILSEFTASEDGSQGRPDSERRLLEIASPQYNHDAGPFGFGPDGYLYFPMGDGGGANDDMYGHVPDWYDRNGGGNGQDVFDNMLGDILRIDVDTQEGDKPYGVPDDNPFVGTDAIPEIYAYGFRNPYGFSIDSQGNVFVADAGQNLFEEADVVERGGNYGWNVKEGTHCFSTDDPSDPGAITDCPDAAPDEAPYDGAELRDPIVEFPHTYQGEAVGITIVGGHRYEQSTIADLEGQYVYGVWTTDPARREPQGRVLTAEPPAGFDGDGTETDAGTATDTETPAETDTDGGDPGAVPRDDLWEMREVVFAGSADGSLPYFVRMFGQDSDGAIYVLVNTEGTPEGDTGAVLRLVPPDRGEQLTPARTETGAETTTVEEPGEEPGDTPTGDGANETTAETQTGAGNETGT